MTEAKTIATKLREKAVFVRTSLLLRRVDLVGEVFLDARLEVVSLLD